jgi:FkbM family methyltransferase
MDRLPSRLTSTLRTAYCDFVIGLVRPYIWHELPGWGKIYAALVGDYRRDWLWKNVAPRTIREKLTGHILTLDLAQWSDRMTFFLGRWYDLHTQLLVRDLLGAGDTVVDVGANRGSFTLVAASLVGPSGKVICFEPNPNCIRLLEQGIEANDLSNIIIHPIGLGDREARLCLSVPFVNSGEGTFGRFAYPSDAGYRIEAQVRKGDDLLANEHVRFIKIDVEGFECRVLEGLRKTIAADAPIVTTEVISDLLLRSESSSEELGSMMKELGYLGHKITLRRDHSLEWEWQLEPLCAEGGPLDAVWFHPERTQPRCLRILKSHGAVVP